MISSGVLFFGVCGDVFQAAVQNAAELVEGVGTYVAVFPQPVQLAGTDAIFFYQLVLGYALGFHGIPEFIECDHLHPTCQGNGMP